MRKKGKIAVSVLVGLIATALALVLLLFLTEIFTGITEKSFHKVVCQIEWLGEAYLKISPSCDASYITIKLDKKREKEEETIEAESLLDVEKKTSVTYYLNNYKDKKEAIEQIRKWSSDDYALSADSHYFRDNYKSRYDEDDTILLEYSMDKIMAEEAKDCWDMVWKGKFPYFDRWWKLFGWDDEKTGRTKVLEIWKIDVLGPPVFCFLCARVTFDKEVADKFNGAKITSLEEWMRNTPVSEYGKVVSYFEYTKDDVHKGLWEKGSGRYNYYAKGTPYAEAIIYARVNKDFFRSAIENIRSAGGTIFNLFRGKFEISKYEGEGDLNALFIVPYAEAAEKCTYMVG